MKKMSDNWKHWKASIWNRRTISGRCSSMESGIRTARFSSVIDVDKVSALLAGDNMDEILLP